jgi:membrane protease subunit (stomatin/prohibitin family)
MTKSQLKQFATQINRNRKSLLTWKTIEETNFIINCEINLICVVAKKLNPDFNEYQFCKDCGEDLL